MVIRRVNFYGGPNIGKTTLVSDLFSRLNKMGLSCGRAEESVKPWAYEGRPPTGFDQVFLFGSQVSNEETILRNSPELVLCEAPLLLCTYYSKRMGMPGWTHLRDLAFEFEADYPALHLLLERGDWGYKEEGRYETEEQALEVDRQVEVFLDECGMMPEAPPAFKVVKVKPDYPPAIVELIMEAAR
jgi:hypothetical protein